MSTFAMVGYIMYNIWKHNLWVSLYPWLGQFCLWLNLVHWTMKIVLMYNAMPIFNSSDLSRYHETREDKINLQMILHYWVKFMKKRDGIIEEFSLFRKYHIAKKWFDAFHINNMQFFRTLFRTGLSVPLHETTFTLISIQMEITFAAKRILLCNQNFSGTKDAISF